MKLRLRLPSAHLRLPALRLPPVVAKNIRKVFRNTRLVIAVGAGVILLMIVPLILWQLRSPTQKVQAAWFDANYGYRKRYPIANSSGSTQTDFQTQLTIDTASLVTAGKMLSSCNDIRFTDINGQTLPYWLEPGTCNTASTLVWVKVPSIPTTGADIYFYYGNPSATSLSATNTTFIRDMGQAAAAWPLGDTVAAQSYASVNNPYLATGRNILTNGTFDADASWTKGTGWTIANGVAHSDGTGTNSVLSQTPNLALPIGDYTVSFTVSNYVSGTIKTIINDAVVGTSVNANGTYSENLAILSGIAITGLQTSTTFVGDIDNFTIGVANTPAYPLVMPPEILTDGDMEAATTAAWTAGTGTSLSKVSGGSPHGGNQVLRLTRTGILGSVATQGGLTKGTIYRVHGYARSDGNAAPSATIGGSSFSGVATTSAWQPFDLVAKATGTTLTLGGGTTVNGQYVEFDDVSVTEDTSIRSGELLADSDMELSGTLNWLPGATETVTKQSGTAHGGANVLRIARINPNDNPYVYQSVLAVGKTYHIMGYARSDGTAVPLVKTTTGTFFTGTNSTSWQFFDITRTTTGNERQVLFGSNATSGTAYVEFDDLSVTEIDPLVGTNLNGVVPGSASGGHLSNAYTFDGIDDNVNIYTPDLNGVFNPNEGTMVAWVKVNTTGVWTDGNLRYIYTLSDGTGNNYVTFYKLGSGVIQSVYNAGGVGDSVNSSVQSGTNWIQIVLTWSKSADAFKVYLNGAQIGTTQTGLGTWAANLGTTSAVIGAVNSAGANPWSGMINDVRLYSRPLSAAEIADQYNASFDIQAYTTGNFSGHELLRKYNASVTVSAPATEETTPGPVGSWNMDEGTGQIVHDGTANATNGAFGPSTANPTWLPEDQCISGKCLRFDGSNDYVNLGAPTALQLTNQITISAWVKPDSVTNTNAGGIVVNNSRQGFWQQANGDLASWIRKSDNSGYVQVTVPSPFKAGTWTHVTLTFDGQQLVIWLNGIQVGATAYTGTMLTSGANPWIIGNFFTGGDVRDFNGSIDEVKIYSYARTADQIKADYNSGAAQLGKKNQQNFLSNGLVGYWKMDENTGTTTTDSSGNGFTGTLTGSPTWVNGKFGPALNFSAASNNYVTAPDTTNSPLDITGSYTLSAWVNPTTLPNSANYIMQKGSQVYGMYLNSSGKVVPTQNNSSKTASTNSVATGSWSHVVVVYNTTTIAIYINGVLDSTQAATGAINTNDLDFQISIASAANDFDGKIDEARVYNRALSAAEVTSLYTWAPGPVTYYPFDDGSGTNAADVSTSGNDGTLTNSPTWVTGKVGSALNFNGSNTYVIKTTPNNLYLQGQDFTISAWINPATTNVYQGIVSRVNGGTNPRWAFGIFNDNKLRFDIVNDTNTTGDFKESIATITPNTWTHVAVVFTAVGTTKFYINGVLDSTQGGNVVDTLNIVHQLRVGYAWTFNVSGQNEYFNGLIDDVKIYNYERSNSQILEDMNAAQSGATAGPNVGVLPKPQAYWKFDEGYGTSTTNFGLAGTALNGTLNNMASPATATSGWTTTGKFNKALNFDGSDDEVSFPSSNLINPAAGTVSMWINPNASQTTPAYAFASPTTTARVYLYFSGSLAISCKLSTGAIIGTVTLTANVWSHVACTWNGTKAAFYVNGQDHTTTATITALAAPVATTSYIGGFDNVGTQNFTGKLDEVRVYNVALTPDQIKLDYNESSSINYGANIDQSSLLNDGVGNPPVAYWNFDEKSGTTAHDSSGNNNNLALTAMNWKTGKYGSSLSPDLTNVASTASIADNASISLTTAGTLEAWVNSNRLYPSDSGTNNFRSIINKWDTGSCSAGVTSDGYFLDWAGTNASAAIRGEVCNGTTPSPVAYTTTLTPNTWYHVVFTWDGSKLKLYLNGVLVSTASQTVALQDDTGTLRVGDGFGVPSASFKWDGKIDEAKIYNYARTPAQVAYDYNRGKPVVWYKMDECQGLTLNDNSGNGFNQAITIGGTGTQTAVGTCNTASTAWGNGSSGKFSSSLSFDGTDDYTVGTGSPVGTAPTGNVTLAAWVFISGNPTTQNSIMAVTEGIGVGGGTSNIGLDLLSNRTVAFLSRQTGFGSGTSVTSSIAISTNAWHLLVGTVDSGGTMRLYIDGISTGGTAALSTISGLDTIAIGAEYTTGAAQTSIPERFFPGSTSSLGQIDDVQIYNYGLSAAQVDQLYNQNSSVRYGPLTGSP